METTIIGYHNKIVSLESYITENRDKWFSTDLKWMHPFPTSKKPGNWCLHKSERKKLDCVKFDVFERSTGEQPEKVFYYWNGNEVDLNLEESLHFFLTQIKLTNNWTPIFTFGLLLHETKVGDYVWYQRYESTEPFVRARNLIGIYAVKHLEDSDLPEHLKGRKVALISLRSVPKDMVPIKLSRKEPQIIWHGAYLLVENGEKTMVHKFDSEDEGGWLFQPLTNFAFPKYVQEEAVLATEYIKNHKKELKKKCES